MSEALKFHAYHYYRTGEVKKIPLSAIVHIYVAISAFPRVIGMNNQEKLRYHGKMKFGYGIRDSRPIWF